MTNINECYGLINRLMKEKGVSVSELSRVIKKDVNHTKAILKTGISVEEFILIGDHLGIDIDIKERLDTSVFSV